MGVTPREGTPGAEHASNLWEELNRPRAQHRHAPPPPTAADAVRNRADASGIDVVTTVRDVSVQVRDALARIDPQHVLLAAAGMFVVVAAFSLSRLGGSGSETAGEMPPAPGALAIVDVPSEIDPAAQRPPIAEPVVVPPPLPTTPAAPTGADPAPPMAMGLPAELLDGAQSKVYRLYRTALGREPDREGFAFWSDQVRAGVPLERLAREFLASEEYVSQFGGDTGWDARVEQLIANAFGPAASPAEADARRERFRGLDGEALLITISESDETLMATGTLR